MRRFWLLLLCAGAAAAAGTGLVAADNCSSPADCEETTNYAVAVTAGAGAAAVGAGVLGATLGGSVGGAVAGATGAEAGAAASQLGMGDPDAPYGRTKDGWPLGPDGRPVPGDWEGNPMIVSDGSTYVDEEGNAVPPGQVWYIDPDGNAHWKDRSEVERIVAEERAEAARSERIYDEAHRRTMEGYEEKKDRTGAERRAREEAEAAATKTSWELEEEHETWARRRREAAARLNAAEAEQAVYGSEAGIAATAEAEYAEGVGRDLEALNEAATLENANRVVGNAVRATHEAVTNPENWRVAAETTAETLKDLGNLARADPATVREVAESLGQGAKAAAKLGVHMATHPVETGKALLGVDNWENAVDPNRPVTERVAWALFAAVDTAMNIGSGGAKAAGETAQLARAANAAEEASSAGRVARSAAGEVASEGAELTGKAAIRTEVKVAEGVAEGSTKVPGRVENAAQAAAELKATRAENYAPKQGGAVWEAQTPRGANPVATGRENLLAQTAREYDEARDALRAAEASGDKTAIKQARRALAEAEENRRAMDRIVGGPKGGAGVRGAAEEAGEAAGKTGAKESAEEAAEAAAKKDAPEPLTEHKGHADPKEVAAREAAEQAAREQGEQTFRQFEKAEDAYRNALKSGDPRQVEAARAKLHKATMEVQMDKNALNIMKQQPDSMKGAFNTQLREGLYDKIDDEVVRGLERRFGLGKTTYIGEAEPGMKVFIDDQGRRIALFEPTNPKPGISVGADRDFVARVSMPDPGDPGKMIMKDVPWHETRALYERGLYKHSGAAQNWPDASVDDLMRKTDQMITDQTHREAYQRSPAEFRRTILDPSRPPPDAGQLAGVVPDKSNHWYNWALDHPERYEEYMHEGMRQSVKQWDNQVSSRVAAIQAQGAPVRVPPDLDEALEVMKQGQKNGWSNVRIEQRLAEIKTPSGRPMTPRLTSQRLGEFWEEMEKLKPPAKPDAPSGWRPWAPGAAVKGGQAVAGAHEGAGGGEGVR